ncbi:MAG: sulfotransferase [Cyanobacteria bacterium P01_A01_bin.116]
MFVVSSGRSGTTLLRGILNATEQIYIPHESDFLARAYPFYQDKKELDEADYPRILNLFAIASQKNGWGMSKDYLFEYFKEKSPRTFSEVNNTIYTAYIQSEGLGDLSWGIKHPVLIASIDKIFNVFPEAKIVHIVRDGRDVCLSYKKVHERSPEKFGPNGTLTTALYWVDGLRRVKENKNSQLYELRYEDILDNPKEELRNLCDFLGLEFTEDMYEDYYKSSKNKDLLLSHHKEGIHSKIKEGIDAQNQKKFLTQMPVASRFLFELLALPYLKKYDYFIEFPFLGNPILEIVRIPFYASARLFNNWRYGKRDLTTFNRSL